MTALRANAENAITQFVTVGGLSPTNGAAKSVASLISVTNAHIQLPAIYEIGSIAQRMQANTALVGTPATPKTVTQGGGNLMSVASAQYGDASRWTDIAAANNITDPFLSGNNKLTIPA